MIHIHQRGLVITLLPQTPVERMKKTFVGTENASVVKSSPGIIGTQQRPQLNEQTRGRAYLPRGRTVLLNTPDTVATRGKDGPNKASDSNRGTV